MNKNEYRKLALAAGYSETDINEIIEAAEALDEDFDYSLVPIIVQPDGDI